MSYRISFSRIHFAVAFLILFASSALISHSQEITSQIKGRVQDDVGSPIPGVLIEARNISSGTTMTTISDNEGKFIFRDLEIGTYSLKIIYPGFKIIQRDNIRTTIGAANELVITMESGHLPERPRDDPRPDYPQVSLSKDEAWRYSPEINLPKRELLRFNKGIFSSPTGIARIGRNSKLLERITDIPPDSDSYKKKGLRIEKKCVYALKADDSENAEIIILRIESVSERAITFRYFIRKDQ